MTTKNSLFSTLQRIGQAFMFPIALLPIAGILLGIGASFSNPQMIDSFHLQNILGSGTFLNFIFTIMKKIGEIIFTNLPIIFAIGIAREIAKKEKAAAAISAAISFLIMHKTISSLLELNGKLAKGVLREGSTALVCGIQSLEMGIFGGIIVGLGVAYLHNKFYKIKLPDVISFFSGIKFVLIISCFCYIFVGALLYLIWPQIQSVIYNLGGLVTASKYTGTLIYGIIERAFIPFGLHHVFYTPFWQTAIGGAEIIDNHYVTGAQSIFFAQLASSSITKFSIGTARFMAGKFPFMIFGLPAAAFAMYKSAKPPKKKVIGGLLLTAAITSMLTGITEPIEFTFLFVAPILYGIHCLLAGLSFMLMHLLKVTVGMTFSGGIIDLILYGVLQGNSKTNWLYIIPVGLGYAIVYYFLFKFVICKFNLITPGRENDELESKLYTKKDFNPTNNNIPKIILKGLGGIENIVDLDCCATKLHIKVKEEEKIDETVLKESGCTGIIKEENSIQIVFGPRVAVIKSELEEYITSLVSKISEEI